MLQKPGDGRKFKFMCVGILEKEFWDGGGRVGELLVAGAERGGRKGRTVDGSVC